MIDAMKSVDEHTRLRHDLMTEMWEAYRTSHGNAVDDGN